MYIPSFQQVCLISYTENRAWRSWGGMELSVWMNSFFSLLVKPHIIPIQTLLIFPFPWRNVQYVYSMCTSSSSPSSFIYFLVNSQRGGALRRRYAEHVYLILAPAPSLTQSNLHIISKTPVLVSLISCDPLSKSPSSVCSEIQWVFWGHEENADSLADSLSD